MSVEVKNLTLTYLRRAKLVGEPVLRDVSFKVEKGERFGILGPTGSGKTTLTLCLNGLIPKEQPAAVKGKIIVDGLDTADTGIETLTQHLGAVFSNPEYAVVEVLVEDDIAFGPSNLNVPREEIQKRVDFAINACRLGGFEKRSTGDLSGGEMQSVAIAGVLAMMTPIMVFDEPVTMLDPIGKERVLTVMRDLNERLNTTIIITESGNDIEYFARLVDRIAVLYDGRILVVDTPRSVFSNSELMEKIGIRPPPVTTIFSDFDVPKSQVPITTEEAVQSMKKLLDARKMKPRPRAGREKIREGKQEPIIVVRNLHHVYPPDVHALKGVDLDIYSGEKVALIGQNGSGKTTLAYHLVGLLKPTNPDAKVVVSGVDVANKKTSLKKDVIKVINYAFQNPDAQLCQETIWDEVTYGLKLLRLPAGEVERRAIEALKLFGIEDKRDVAIIQASLDLKRYTTIACLIAMGPGILILDEPTNGLDYDGGMRVMEVLRMLNETKGLTGIIITHNMELVAGFANRIIVLKDGNILMDGSTREVFSTPDKLKEAYLYPPQTARLFQALPEYGFPRDVLLPEETKDVLAFPRGR